MQMAAPLGNPWEFPMMYILLLIFWNEKAQRNRSTAYSFRNSDLLKKQLNKSWPNQDNSILFEDLWFVETPPPMGGCVGGWVGKWSMWKCHIPQAKILLKPSFFDCTFKLLYFSVWRFMIFQPMGGCMDQWVGSGPMEWYHFLFPFYTLIISNLKATHRQFLAELLPSEKKLTKFSIVPTADMVIELPLGGLPSFTVFAERLLKFWATSHVGNAIKWLEGVSPW